MRIALSLTLAMSLSGVANAASITIDDFNHSPSYTITDDHSPDTPIDGSPASDSRSATVLGGNRSLDVQLLSGDSFAGIVKAASAKVGTSNLEFNIAATNSPTGRTTLTYGAPDGSFTEDFTYDVGPLLGSEATGFISFDLAGSTVPSIIAITVRDTSLATSATTLSVSEIANGRSALFSDWSGGANFDVIDQIIIEITAGGNFTIDDLAVGTTLPEPTSVLGFGLLGLSLVLVQRRRRK